MRKNLTKKLFLSVLTLAFAVISLGASTYAWFTMSKEANVESFTADVQAGKGIEIAVTAGTNHDDAQWYTGTIESDVVQEVVEEANFSKFAALTTTDAVNFEDVTDPNATIDGTYLSFYIHIKAAEQGTILVDDNSGVTFDSKQPNADATDYVAVTPWTADAAYQLDAGKKVEVNDPVLYKVENAARVALIVNNNTYIYENAFKAAEDMSDYLDANNQVGTTVKNGALAYYNSKVKEGSSLTAPTTEQYSTNHAGENFTSFNEAIQAGEAGILTIQVVVWVEGWDAECLNAIFAQQLSVALAFKFQ